MLLILKIRVDDSAFKYKLQEYKKIRKIYSKITISRLSGINLSNYKSTKKVKNKELNAQLKL